MPTTTTNYSLLKPLVNNATDQDLWGGYLNTNFDTIDTKLKLGIDRVKRAITSTDSLVAGDRKKTITADATSAEITFSLLAAATAGDGFEFTIVKTDSSGNAVIIDPDGSEKVAGGSTYTLSGEGDAVTLVCDGSAWWITGSKATAASVASATTSSEGIVELATTTETQTGTDSARVVTTAGLKAALGFSKYYDSGNQSFSPGSQVLLTHSLGAVPKLAQFELVCVTTDLGYAVGDRVALSTYASLISSAPDDGFSVGYNATKLFVNVNAATPRMVAYGGGSGTTTGTMNTSSWRIVARAWA